MQSLAGPTDSLNEWQILLKGQEISLNKRANMTLGPGIYKHAGIFPLLWLIPVT